MATIKGLKLAQPAGYFIDAGEGYIKENPDNTWFIKYDAKNNVKFAFNADHVMWVEYK
jgi:hypothetical protein